MLRLRKIGTVLLAAWGLGLVAKALCEWILGLEGAAAAVPEIVATLAGALAGISEARALEPWPPSKSRDAIIGGGTVVALGAVIACVAMPVPVGAIAAVAVAGLAIVLLRRVPKVEA